MTLAALYRQLKSRLKSSDIDEPGPEAAMLLEHFYGCDMTRVYTHPDTKLNESPELMEAVNQRCAGRPMQYILGKWPFMELELSVGEGVLIPREDSAVLVNAVTEYFAGKHRPEETLRGADLCSGTGAIALALASQFKISGIDADITAVELSKAALVFLNRNLESYNHLKVQLFEGDILDPALPGREEFSGLDFIASNPPYIESSEISGLQREVQNEPAMALDGGRDGLSFYRAIAAIWTPCLKPGGLLAVETGETQGPAVSEIFIAAGLIDIAIKKDLSGLDRVVTGRIKL